MRSFLPIGLVACLMLTAAPARGDWEVKRAPDDPRVGEALLVALLSAPDDPRALRRLVAHAGGKRATSRFADRCETRAQGLTRLACGHLRREAGEPDAARARFAEAAAAAPDDPRPHRAAGELLAKLGRADEALTELEAARARARPAERATILEALLPLYAIARQAPQSERQQSAIAAAEALTALRPDDPALRRRLAETLASVGAVAQATSLLSDLAQAARDPQARLPLLFRLAELAEEAKRDDDAIAALDQALVLLPAHDARRGEALERISTIERRREQLPVLAARWSALPEARRDAALEGLLGRLLDELGDRAQAQRHLQRAIRLDPRALGPRRALIRVYTRAGDEGSAITELRRLVAMSGGDARLQLELAERLYARSDGNKEALALAGAIGQRHRDATTHAALAALYEKWGARDRALAEQTLLTRLEPNDPEHLIALGELYDQRGDKAAAQRTWRRLAAGPNPSLAATLRLVDVQAEHDQLGEALALLELLAHDHPGDATIERRLADVLDRLHRDGEAENLYRHLLEGALKADDAAAVRELGARWLELVARKNGIDHALQQIGRGLEHPKTSAQVELALLMARGRLRERRGLEAERLLRELSRDASRPGDRARALEALAEVLSARPGAAAVEALDLLLRAANEDPARAPLLYGKASERAASLYRDDDALRYAERAVALAPQDADAHERLAALLEPRDPARALTELDRALELDGGRDRLRLRAAELALRRGDDEGAAARYRALLGRAHDEQAIEDAARRAVVVHELTGRLGELEREVAPRATSTSGRPALRRLLIEIDRRYVPPLAARGEVGDPTARDELRRVATHALAPLLDAVLEGDRDERRAAVQLIGQLGAHGAAPLLLRLAVGEAARRGAEPPPTDLRIAAAEAVSWLVMPSDLAWLDRMAADPEQRIRLAATVGLGRLAADGRALARLLALVGDDHDRVSAAACLGLAALEPPPPPTPKVLQRAFDTTRPLAARACAVAVARRVEHDPTARPIVRGWRERVVGNEALAPSPGVLRALLAAGDEAEVELALGLALRTSSSREALLGRRDPAAVGEPPRNGSAVDLMAWLAIRETATRSRDGKGLHNAAAALIERVASSPASTDPSLAAVLADLSDPAGLLAHLSATGGGGAASLAASRLALLDLTLPTLARIAQPAASAPAADPAARHLALALLALRPAGLGGVAAAARDPDAHTRRAALEALESAPAVKPSDLDAPQLLSALRAALTASDWRERRLALACLRRHRALASQLEPERAALRADPNELVADLARERRDDDLLGAPPPSRAD